METVSCLGCRMLQRQVDELKAEVQRLKDLHEQALRAGKRQAAPFSKKPPTDTPKKSGRKPGKDYGAKGHRPPPDEIDEVHQAALPESCPHCGGELEAVDIQQQYQTEIPRKPIRRQFDVHIGKCSCCKRRVQGRHPLQTSDALGAAASQLGPDAQAAVVDLNKNSGMSHGKVARTLETLFGIPLTRVGSVHTILRTANRCQGVYEEIRQDVRKSPQVVLDETGWRVGGKSAWLHGLVGEESTVYVIDPTRSHQPAKDILGLNYQGVMTHDGWSVYDCFLEASHQQCVQHILRRCDEMLKTARGGAVRFPRRVAELLREGLTLRDRHEQGEISHHGLQVLRGRLQNELEEAIFPAKRHKANETLAAHLWNHIEEWFTFLKKPGLDATNWQAEQAMRFGVILRKVWGGSRTWIGAKAQAILMSVWRTCWQQSKNAVNYLSQLLRGGQPVLLAQPP